MVFDNIPFCHCPDSENLGNKVCKWNRDVLVYGFRNELPGLTRESLAKAFEIAFSRWEAVCNIRGERIKTPQDAVQVIIDTGRIDGPSGTLAWAELPCGNQSSLKMKLDIDEPFILSDNPPPNKIDLIRVVTHELGHILGIPHIENGNLMAPMYSRQIYLPQAGDIREGVRRYGEPTTRPTEPDPDPENPKDQGYKYIRVPADYVFDAPN